MALAGLTVLDLSTIVSGGMASSLLADFGAEVVKVEHPNGGDPLRAWGPFLNGQSIWWKVMSRNKKSVTLNLGHPRGQRILRELATRADVLIENFRPGTLERWGVGPEELRAANPRLIVLRISGFGQTGPYRHRPGFGTIAEAMSGFAAISGFPDSPPLLPPLPLADEIVGLMGATAALIAVYHRQQTGRGDVIDIALYEPLFRLLIPQITQYLTLGIPATRRGNHFADAAPRNLYQTRDGGWIAISATSQRTFERLAAAIGQPELSKSSEFLDNAARVQNREKLDAILAAWMAQRSRSEVLSNLEEAGVVAGPVYDFPEIVGDPQYAAREDIIVVPDPDAGQIPMVGVIPKLQNAPGSVSSAGPALGAHNRDVYRGWLAIDDAEIESLRAEEVL